MSKVAIQGNASGTGTFTIAAPNSNTDRTLTLPDEAGTVLTSGGAIDVDASAPVDSVVIDSSGNLGVGTISDGSIGHFKNATGNATLKVEGGTTAGNDAYANIEIGNTTGTSGIFFSDTTNGVGRITYEHNGDYMRMYTGSTERMRIESSGRVGVNMTSTYAQLDVQRTDSTTNPSIRAYNTYASFSGNDLFQTYQVGQGSSSLYNHIGCFSTGGAKRFQVRGDGNVTNSNNSYGAISDQNLKENIALSGSQWDDIKALQVKKYSYISEGLDEPNQLGVIAQDLEASGMSGLVENNQALFWHEDEDLPEGVAAGDVKVAEHKSVKYSVLYMKSVKALQEAMERIETLEAKVAALEATP